MTPKPSVIFDTSSWNQLLKDPQSSSVASSIKNGFFIRVTATSVLEIAATPQAALRKELLSLCRSMVDDCLHPPNWITDALICSFEQSQNTFDWWNVLIEWPELQQKLATPDFFDNEIAGVTRAELRGREQQFGDLFSLGRKPIEETFRQSEEERPKSFHEYLPVIPEELLKKGQSFYSEATKREPPPKQVIARFIAVCPPFRALANMAFVPEYEYWIRNLHTSESCRAGANDLFSAVYLPYCNKFVTDDQRQLRALELVAVESDLKDVGVLSYKKFREML